MCNVTTEIARGLRFIGQYQGHLFYETDFGHMLSLMPGTVSNVQVKNPLPKIITRNRGVMHSSGARGVAKQLFAQRCKQYL